MKAENGAKLVFTDGGKSVYIQFSNGSESLSLESKVEALAAIEDCLRLGKLTKADADKLQKEIVLAEKLQNNDPKVLAGFAISLMLFDALFADDLDEEDPLITDPYVALCDCGNKIPHAYVYNGDGTKIGMPFKFKNEGLLFVEHLFSTERITEGDRAELNTVIELLPIPDDPCLN